MTSGDDPFEEGQPFLFGAAEQESPTRGKAVSRLTDEISRLEEECSRLRHLTSSLLATLQLPRNRAIFLQFDEWLAIDHKTPLWGIVQIVDDVVAKLKGDGE